MLKIIKKYKNLPFESKTLVNTKISIFNNTIIAIFKFILAIVFRNVFFFVAGVINICMLFAKLECYLGEKVENKKSFSFRNNLVGLFVLIAGIQYSIYMGRLIYTNLPVMKYDMYLGITIALVSFIELSLAIRGCFKVYGKGHFLRNIKIINLCSSLTAIVLTSMAILSFASTIDHRFFDALFGLIVGGIIVLLSIYIFISPKISIVGKEKNNYCFSNYLDLPITKISEEKIVIKLTNSKICGNYIYYGEVDNNLIVGEIKKERSPIYSYNIFLKIVIIILSEILIFFYGIYALIFHFKCYNLIDKLDKIMKEKGYEKN